MWSKLGREFGCEKALGGGSLKTLKWPVREDRLCRRAEEVLSLENCTGAVMLPAMPSTTTEANLASASNCVKPRNEFRATRKTTRLHCRFDLAGHRAVHR